MEELWKDIINYEGLYQISSLGRILIIKTKKIKKLSLTKMGYYGIMLLKDKKSKNFLIHRLIAIHFIPNPNNLPIINHKDYNKLNNNIDNLEWCTYSHNINHAYDNGKGTNKGKALTNSGPRKEVVLIRNDVIIKQWKSLISAAKELNVLPSSISQCCRGIISQTHGMVFRFKDSN
jgi:NUMOD4 motif-containing protein/HNH endonuclease